MKFVIATVAVAALAGGVFGWACPASSSKSNGADSPAAAMTSAGGNAVIVTTANRDGSKSPSASRGDIVSVAQSAGSFKTLLKAAEAAGLVDALKQRGPITVFAPTDEAFGRLDSKQLADLLKPENREKLRAILTYHVVPSSVTFRDLIEGRRLTTVNGQQIRSTFNDGSLSIGHSRVLTSDVMADNGVIHVINNVLTPSTQNIPETAAKAGKFITLLTAVKAAGLSETLSGPGPFTVFAPNDAAFAKLPGGTLESLLKPENRETLASVLTYHVVPGRIYSRDAALAGKAKTVQGSEVRLAYKDGSLEVNSLNIIDADLDTTNGVIHVIDGVLLPEASSNPDSMSKPAAANTPRAALELAIERGVPLFNAGQQEACAAVYEVAITSALAQPGMLGDKAANVLRTALREGAAERDVAERAWIFRRAMDRALGMM